MAAAMAESKTASSADFVSAPLIGQPHYTLPSDVLLTEAQRYIAEHIASGNSIIVFGDAATGKSTALTAGFSRRHLVVPDIFIRYFIDMAERKRILSLPATHADAMIPMISSTGELKKQVNPLHDMLAKRQRQEEANQAAEDAAHFGLLKLQLCHVENEYDEKDVRKLVEEAWAHPENGSVCLCSWEKGDIALAMLKSSWLRANCTKLQLVMAVGTGFTGKEAEAETIQMLAAKWGIPVIHLKQVLYKSKSE